MRDLIFLTNFCLKSFSFPEEMNHALSQMSIGLHVKFPLFLSNCNEICIFWTVFFRKILDYQISWRSVLWECSCSMPTDRRMTKPIVAFRNYANALKTALVYFLHQRRGCTGDCTDITRNCPPEWPCLEQNFPQETRFVECRNNTQSIFVV